MKSYTITVNGNVYDVTVEEGSRVASTPVQSVTSSMSAPKVTPEVVPAPKIGVPAQTAPASTAVPSQTEFAPKAAAPNGAGNVKVSAPMPGKILSVKASVGQAVKRGEVILILEAMKMENEIVASQDGVVASIDVSEGQSVESGEVLATLN